jgi:DNA-binding NtrC family response regulator
MTGDADGRAASEPGWRPKVLIIDEDELSRALVADLEECGVQAQRAYNQSQARALLRSLHFDVVVSEAALPDGDGEVIFREAIPFLKSTPFIFTVREADVEQAVRTTKAGCLDYIVKPYDSPSLAKRIRSIVDVGRGTGENAQISESRMHSPAMALIAEQLRKLASTDVSVLFVGEVGSGKKALARRLHQISSRSAARFVDVRCGGLAGQDAERMLFGDASEIHRNAGSAPTPGTLEQAGEGTLFLDHIEELPLALQMRLLQAIDEKRFHRVDDVGTYVPFRARLLSSSELTTNELRQRINPDLLYRLAVVEVRVPPFRSRQEDVEYLVNDLIEECAAEIGGDVLPIDPEAIAAIRVYEWPGNMRELKTRLLRALSLGNGKKISATDIFPELGVGASVKLATRHLDEARAAAEREQIVQTLAATDGRIGHAARQLGISRVTLWMKMKRLGLQHGSDRPAEVDESSA